MECGTVVGVENNGFLAVNIAGSIDAVETKWRNAR